LQTFIPQDSLDELIERAVARAVRTSAVEDFVDWFSREIAEDPGAAGWRLDADGVRAVGSLLGRSLWSATPAPHNDFKPKTLTAPGRNAPCLCGSGLKFKRCCALGPPLPRIEAAEIWPVVLEVLPNAERKAALESGKVPVESLVMSAARAAEAGRHKFAIGLLEPLFTGSLTGTGVRDGMALMALCDAYDAAGRGRKKIALLERVRSEAPRSPLRSDACQRLATIALDRGDSAGAWAAFGEAQRDEPDSPSIGLLEVQLLIFEHRTDEARERARFWRRRLQRMRDPDLDDSIDFLTAIVENPVAAITGVLIDANAGAGERLNRALEALDSRPLPRYTVVAAADAVPDTDPGAAVAARLRGMGIREDQVEEITRDLLAQIEALEPPDFDADLPASGDEAPSPDDPGAPGLGAACRIVAPAALGVIEADWHAVYPVGKPFSVNAVPSPDEDPWDPAVEDRWMSFLERHPEAFDSVDVLDDLAGAVALHPAGDALGAIGALQQPLVERAAAILRRALEQRSNDPVPDTEIQDPVPDTATETAAITLPWPDTDNRPALRCLHAAHALAAERGDPGRAREHAELLLRLNPGDNHGVRAGLMNLLLRDGDDEAALALAAAFEHDMLAEIPYGKVLALVRLGRLREAAEAARQAARMLPEVRRYLTRERAKRPEIHDFGIRVGGKDQAWIYREAMRDVWLESPDALALITRTRPG
jgi:tetratricopeptide (TPR) repeat protein